VPGTGLYAVKTAPTKNDDTQSGAPAGQVITLTTGGLGTASAFAGGYVENVTRAEIRAIVSHADSTVTLEGNLAAWLGGDDLDVYDSWAALQTAADQLWTDQGAAQFTAAQEFRVYAGTYTEDVLLNAGFVPVNTARLLIRANTGDAPKFINTALASHTLDTNGVECVTIEDLEFESVIAAKYAIQAQGVSNVFRRCTITGAAGSYALFQGAGARADDCVVTASGNDYAVRWPSGDFERCSFHGGRLWTRNSWSAAFVACAFDGAQVFINGLPASPSPRGKIPFLNCVFYNRDIAINDAPGAGAGGVGLLIRNCVFLTCTTAICVEGPAEVDSDANIFWDCDKVARYDGADYITLADWQTAVDDAGNSPDGFSLEADPKLTDPANDDWTLAVDSPARRAGEGVGIRTDIAGVAFNRRYPDVGVRSGETSLATPVWPSDLPQKLEQTTYSETLPSVTVRTEMDSGAPKVRRRFTAGIENIQGTMLLTRDEAETLDTWFNETLQGGAVSFQWKHPRRETEDVEMRFLEPPSLAARGAINFTASMSLEVLP
jgi:hypothetical protein